MGFEKHHHIWTGALLAIFCVALVAFAFVSRKPLCIDSRIVEKIDSISEKGSAHAYRCTARRHVSFDEELDRLTTQWTPRIQKLERFFEMMDPLHERVSITVLETQESVLKVHGHHIFLSVQEAQASGVLEKAIMMVWFRERAPHSLFVDPLVEETWTDLMLTAMNGALTIRDMHSQFSLHQDREARWPLSLMTWESYCESPWRLMSHLPICRSQEDLSMKEHTIATGSVRPILSQAWSSAYQKLSPSQQMKYMKSMAKKLPLMTYSTEVPALTEATFEFLDYEESMTAVKAWTETVQSLDLDQEFSLYPLLNRELEKRGFSTHQDFENRLEILVLSQKRNEKVKGLFFDALEKNPMLAAWEDNSDISFQAGRSIPKRALRSLNARKIIYLTCGRVTFDHILKLSERTQSVTVIESCEDSVVQFEQYLKKGILGFAGQNQELPFVEFHLPSLKMALNKLTNSRSIMNAEIDLKKPETFAFLPKDRSEFNPKLNIYRVESAVEAIPYYRPRTN